MRILVTGGAGFIGSHLAERLVARGHRVVVLDDLSTGKRENLRGGGRGVELVVGSVLDQPLVERLMDASLDRVFHLAATVGVERVALHPGHTLEVIADGSRRVLDAAAARTIPTIAVSSSEVYGFAPRVPVREEDVLTVVDGDAARLAYVRAKLIADAHGCALHQGGAPVLTLRPFNVIGPRQSGSGGAVLPRFVERALAGDPLEVHGDGEQRRTFLDVRDLSAMLADLAERERCEAPVVNVGGVDECSMADLARRVVARLGSASRVEHVAPPALRGGVEIRRRVPDLTRLRRMIVVAPFFTLDDSIDALAAELGALAGV